MFYLYGFKLFASVKSSRPKVFFKKVILKTFEKTQLFYWSLCFNKFVGCRPTTSLKRNSSTDVFLWILRHFSEYLWTSTSDRGMKFLKLTKMLSCTFSGNIMYTKTGDWVLYWLFCKYSEEEACFKTSQSHASIDLLQIADRHKFFQSRLHWNRSLSAP